MIGEGSAIVVLEDMDSAKRRGANIYGAITGFWTSCDGTHRIMPGRDGKGLARAIRNTLDSAGYQPQDIDYICADGAATELGDISETRAIKDVFGSYAYHIPVSAPKSMFGHMLGASGAVDLVVTLLSMNGGVILPTINYQTEDTECDLDYVPNKSRAKEINRALVISRGRGGINAVMAVERSTKLC